MNKRKYGIHLLDARNIASISSHPIVDVTITSPPYYDMKDYGYPEQIGFGQKYEDYLEDLERVFSGVFALTKDSGSLWVIIDTLRKDGVVIPLPFDFANRISKCGWKLKEIIIWEKDKTVPWIHQGQMRNMFEYILVFSKGEKYNFFIDRLRQWTGLKKWWVKYPERYNPKGKAPEALWRFPIPIQGSWGQDYVRHFCPLPEELIAQIIQLTTDEDDVVLDPFAGSGAVLSQAHYMKRKYIGAELNKEYINMFNEYLAKTGGGGRKKYSQSKVIFGDQNRFAKAIVDLRALKYARILFKKIGGALNRNIVRIYVADPIFIQKNISIAQVEYSLILTNKNALRNIKEKIDSVVIKPPLSKFGITPSFKFDATIDEKSSTPLYGYTKTVTHKFQEEIHDISSSHCFIVSPIKVNFEEEDYE